MQCLWSTKLALNHSQGRMFLNKLHHSDKGTQMLEFGPLKCQCTLLGGNSSRKGMPADVLSHIRGVGSISCRCAPGEQPPVPGWEAGAAAGWLGVRRVEGMNQSIPYRSPAAPGAWVGVPGVPSWHSATVGRQRKKVGIRSSSFALRRGRLPRGKGD